MTTTNTASATPVLGSPITPKKVIYDASAINRILDLPCECKDSVPDTTDDSEAVIYYGGWDLQTLRSSPAGLRGILQNKSWYDGYNWYDKHEWRAEPAYYSIFRIRMPTFYWRTDEQVKHLRAIDERLQIIPVTVAVTALLAHLTEERKSLLKGRCRCNEYSTPFERVVLHFLDGRIVIRKTWPMMYETDFVLWAVRKH